MSNASDLLTLPWLLAEIFAVLVILNGFLLSKYFNRFERFTTAVTNLDKTIALLYEKLNQLQTNDAEKTKSIKKLTTKINRLKNFVIRLKTTVDHCQSQNNCIKETHHEPH
jgi:hypothetical protein